MLFDHFADKTSRVGENKIMYSLVNNWLSFIRLRFCGNTYNTYAIAAKEFLNILPSKIKPEKITPFHIEQYVQNLIETNHSPKTANTYLAAIKSFYRWAEKYCELPNQAKSVSLLKEPPSNVRILKDQEYYNILQFTPTKQHRNAFQFLANTGLRIHEFRSLRWEHFNKDFVHVIGKGNKSRFVPVNNICKKIIGNHNKSGTPLFVRSLSKHTPTYRLCAKISKLANIKPFAPHAFRHYFATRLIRKGVPLIIVSKILGHANTQITEKIYVHLVPQDLKVTDCLEY